MFRENESSEMKKNRERRMALVAKQAYRELFDKAIDRIWDLPSGSTFVLNHVIDTPPALLGRRVVESTREGGQLFGLVEQIGVRPSRFTKL